MKNPDLIPPLRIKSGCFSSETIDPKQIENKIAEIENKLELFEENLCSASLDQHYFGTAFIIFEK